MRAYSLALLPATLILALGLVSSACGDAGSAAGDDWSGDGANWGGDETGDEAAWDDGGDDTGAGAEWAGDGDDVGAAEPPEVPEPPPADADPAEFESVGTNPFVMTAHNPISSFAADVDTASYDIFRQQIDVYGQLPDPDSVRLEEFVNAFDYHDAAPELGVEEPFGVQLEAAPSRYTDTTVLRIGMQGKIMDAENRPPANLVFLVDVSGSMNNTFKLPLVKVLIAEVASKLQSGDRVSIVTYASVEQVLLPPTSPTNMDLITDAIDSLEAGGSTAGQKGLEMAYEQAEAGFVEGGANNVFLCTDGDFNVGISDTDELVHFIQTKRETGIMLTAVGFGSSSLNDEMMEKVSNAGNGIYAVIGDADQAVEYAHDKLWGAIFTIAKDVKIQVVFNPETVSAFRLLGYENRLLTEEEFEDDTTDAGEIGAGHHVTALYELILTGDDIPEAEGAPDVVDGEGHGIEGEELDIDVSEIAHVKVRYKLPHMAVEDESIELIERFYTDEIAADAADASDDLSWASSIAAFAEILKGSPYGRLENLPMIGETCDATSGSAPDRNEFLSLFSAAQSLLVGAE